MTWLILITAIILCCMFPHFADLIVFLSVTFWIIILIISQVESNENNKLEIANQQKEYEEYVQKLLNKYGNKRIVDNILNHEIWVGQTQEMLIDSLGNPEYIQKHQLKTKYKEIWNYNKIGKGRYGVSVILENEIVVAYRI